MKKFVSNSQESMRMFKSPLFEALSKVHFTVPLYIFVPVIAYCTYQYFQGPLSILTYFELFIGGLFIWTFVEYIMHRLVFHYVPADKPGHNACILYSMAFTMITLATACV